MKKIRIKKAPDTPDCAATVKRCIETVDGLEEVRINMDTGEITYRSGTCTDPSVVQEALAREGIETEVVP